MENKESIIVSADHKNALICILLMLASIVAIKWFIIGYWYGKRECE